MSNDIVNAIPFAALLIGTDGRVLIINPRAKELLGQAVEGRHYITVLRQPDLLDAVERALGEGQPTEAMLLTSVARQDVTLKATCRPVPHSGNILICFEDRTEMEGAGQIRRDFVANVSHELRTPLTALLGFIETLRGSAKNDPAAQARFLDIMQNEAERMNRLVADLLSLSGVEANERVRPTEKVNLAAIALSAISTLSTQADENNIELVAENLSEPAELPGDADQLSQVVTNLVENAIKYSGSGKRVRIRITQDDANPMVRGAATILTVTDNGEGIDPLSIPRLTERFYRIDNHRSREMGGTGLGLAIVKHIVNRHRGRLRIESEVGKGSQFSVILPRSAAMHV